MHNAVSQSASRNQADFYVAPTGQDSHPGTAALPFATLTKARDAVRERIRTGLHKDILVQIRGGTYQQTETLTLGPDDSGTEEFSVTYAAAPEEKVVLSGGRTITGWRKGAGEIWTTEIPEVKEGKWYFRQLFVNDRRAIRARTPNADDQTPWWNIQTSSAGKDTNDPEDIPIAVTVSRPIKAYGNPTDVELVFMQNNESGQKRLSAINEKDQSLALAAPHRWNPKAFICDWMLSKPFAGKACYLENALEMLDQPGEWYLDRQTGVLSYWPRPGEDLTKAAVVAPVAQNTVLAVLGTDQRSVLNVHFRGIHVRYVDWPLPAWGYTALFCCNVATFDGPKPGHRFIEAAVEYVHARRCSFTDGGIAHVGGMGLCLREGTAFNIIEGNEIADVGGGGIGAGGCNTAAAYLDAAPPPSPGEFKGYRICNNYVHHCGETWYGAVGISLFLAQEAVISHNLIHDTAYFGIGVAGSQDPKVPFARDNVIEYNHIFNAMKVTIDGAGMYVTFANHGQGTLIRGNLIHDTWGNPHHEKWGAHPPSAGIYLDGYNSGCRYEGNVLYRNLAAGPLIFNYADAAGRNTWVDNLFHKEGTPPQELIEVMEACTGLEPDYQKTVLNKDPNPCQYSSLVVPGATNEWAAYQFDLPAKGRGVVEIIRRPENVEAWAILRLRGLEATARYALTGYAGALVPSAVWGPGSMNMVSDVVPLALSDIGLSPQDGQVVMNGRDLTTTGLAVKLEKSSDVVWVVYNASFS